ncbi:unnamed protein product [Brassica rapa]|uniref:Uncharacterized protein n=2 Tax=Brassica TaxID=3705 RepID=A0A8D9M6J2_BRACM|nr:unnamed protein product [Brassica rapa]
MHMSMSLGPSASDPTSIRKSLIMERMGDKYIFKRAFKTFQKSYDFTSCVHDQKQLLQHQSPAKATSIPSCQKENGRPTKSSCLEKRSGSSAIRSSSYGLKSNNTAENKQTKGGNISLSQEADGGLSLAMQEDSRRSGKITCAGMYFLGFPVYSLDHTITSMAQEKNPETALFKSLDGFQQCEVTELKAGTHIFAVYGDNFFKSVSYTIQVLCAASFTQEKEDLRSVEAQILNKRAELAKFETEYREIDELLKQRNEIHSAYTTVPLIERSSNKNRLRKSLFKKAVAEAPAPIVQEEEEEEEEEESSRQRNKKPNTCDDESETLKKKTRWYNLHLKLDKKKPC